MGASFDARLAKARRAIDQTFAESWIFRPMSRPAGPNAPAVADPDRAVIDPFTAIPVEQPALSFDGRRVASFQPAPSAGGATTVNIVAGAVDVRTGDRLEAKSTGQIYVLSEPQPLGRGRVTWRLSLAR